MCKLPKNAGDDCFLKWFQELFDIYMNDAGKAKTIAEAIERSWMFEIAKVLFYHVMKKISKQDCTTSDLGKWAALVNAVKGILPFALIHIL